MSKLLLRHLQVRCSECDVDLIKDMRKTYCSSSVSEKEICEIIRNHKTLFHDAIIIFKSNSEVSGDEVTE